MARIVIFVGHARTGTYCEALGEAYREGAEAAGHDAKLFVTAKMAFDPILREAYRRCSRASPILKTAYQAMLAADHLVFVFPLWLGDMPRDLRKPSSSAFCSGPGRDEPRPESSRRCSKASRPA